MEDKKTRVRRGEGACEGEGSVPSSGVAHLAVLVNCGATMRTLEDRVVKELNAVAMEHGNASADLCITVFLAGERTEVAVRHVPVGRFIPLEHGVFRMRGCCMLMDALYEVIFYMEEAVLAFGDCVKIVVITNDAEAASCVYPYADVLALVEGKRAAGWEFELRAIC